MILIIPSSKQVPSSKQQRDAGDAFSENQSELSLTTKTIFVPQVDLSKMSVSAGPLPSINNGNAYDVIGITNEVKCFGEKNCKNIWEARFQYPY